MSASQQAVQRVTAMKIAAALRSYERHIVRLVPSWLDVDLYQTASVEIDQVRAWCGTLPGVSVPWIALLISHADLMLSLWNSAGHPPGACNDEIQQRLAEHVACIHALAHRCQQLAGVPLGDVQPPDGAHLAWLSHPAAAAAR